MEKSRRPARGTSSLLQLAARKHPESLVAFNDILDVAKPSTDAAPCLHPACTRVCRWPLNGRPARFCGVACKQDYLRTRERLLGELRLLTGLLDSSAGESDARRRIRKEVAQREWVLERYPALG